MPSGTPCRVGRRAGWDTVRRATPCRVGTVLVGVPSLCRLRCSRRSACAAGRCKASAPPAAADLTTVPHSAVTAVAFHTTCAARRVPHVVAPPCDACCMPPWFRWAPSAHPTVLHPSPRVTTGNHGSMCDMHDAPHSRRSTAIPRSAQPGRADLQLLQLLQHGRLLRGRPRVLRQDPQQHVPV